LLVPAALVVIGGGIACGFWGLMRYERTPGRNAQQPVRQWPVMAGGVPRSGILPTLIVTLHPGCPCSRATLAELSRLMTHCHGKLECTVLFVQEPGLPDDITQSDYWKLAASIPGVTPRQDTRNLAVDVFGARTSGQTFLYDLAGGLVYQGGITDGRGHEGDNAGRSAIEQYVLTGATVCSAAPVYGCALR
jgi:hypothetical protein